MIGIESLPSGTDDVHSVDGTGLETQRLKVAYEDILHLRAPVACIATSWEIS